MKEKQIYLLKSFLFECFAVLLVISEVITMNDLSIVMKRKKHVEVLKNNNIDYVQTSNVLPDFDGSSYNIYFSSSINVPQVDELLDLYLRKDGGG
ncbi:MAG: hypothetical protein IJ091_08595, partial [Oscillospiraceae bacterium]|nr:hypothetical protein [Oscillospiraceae bacterium]